MKNIIERLHTKRIILSIIIILWMCVVFYLSNQSGEQSSGTSFKITNMIVSMYTKITKLELTNQGVGILTFIVRKIAHFTLYFVEVIPIYLLLKTYNVSKKRMYMYALLFCTLYSCSDELHQLFIQGRDGNIIDVFIDTIGSTFGIIFVGIVSNIVYNFKE